jgi:AcrR family transcriptional regulator
LAQPVDRRTLLIRAAGELFTEHAYDEVTTTEIARRAGVAYGLIAHHFGNKRGLFLATVRDGADRLRAVRDSPPEGDSPAAKLRNAITRHLAYIDDNAAGFLALMRSGNGADPEVRTIIDELRWEGGHGILRLLGAAEPVPTVLRASIRGWVGYLDELIVDHLRHQDLPRRHLVDLATATLVTTLRTAATLDPKTGISPEILDSL